MFKHAIGQPLYLTTYDYDDDFNLGSTSSIESEFDEPERPSMSLLIGSLPDGAEFEIVETNVADGIDKDTLFLEEKYESCLLFADPWAPIEKILRKSNLFRPGKVLAGGISCPYLADQKTLAVNGRSLAQGSVVAVGFAGSLGLQTLVAQGCRSVSSIFTVTACEGNVILKLNGKPALEVSKEMANNAPPEEQELISSGLLRGLASSDATDVKVKDEEPCDFLSRQIMGFAPSVGGIAVGTKEIQVDDLFCFQVRDGLTAKQDLKIMVQRAKTAQLFDNTVVSSKDNRQSKPIAAIQISCIARGRGMFDGIPHVDLKTLQDLTASTDKKLTIGGFFANGEIGPLGLSGFRTSQSDGKSFLHSFTTVAAMLCEYTSSSEAPDGTETQEQIMDAWG